jgi:hypothetical protein
MAEQQKKQTMRFTDKELSLIKNTFAENDDALKIIRKTMLQLPLTEAEEIARISIFKHSPELSEILRKCYLPELTDDVPFSQLIDLWMTVNIKEMSPEMASMHLNARYIVIEYIKDQLKVLNGEISKPNLRLAELLPQIGSEDRKMYVNLLARNTIVEHTEQQILMLMALAGMKNETVEETMERLRKNSNK